MIAVDSNVLVYAHREDSPWHGTASTHISQLAQERAPWAIPWPCVHEFLAIVTHARMTSGTSCRLAKRPVPKSMMQEWPHYATSMG